MGSFAIKRSQLSGAGGCGSANHFGAVMRKRPSGAPVAPGRALPQEEKRRVGLRRRQGLGASQRLVPLSACGLPR
jgi:hypothetical protein